MKNPSTKWSPEDDQVLIKFYPKEKTKDVCKKLSRYRTETSVIQRAKKLNLKKDSYEFWSDSELSKLKQFYASSKKSELEKMFANRSWLKIKAKANELGLKKRTLRADQVCGDLTPLLESSAEALYWIGFILADGHLSNNNRLQVSLSSLDEAHLLKLCSFIRKESIRTHGRYCHLSIMDQDIVSKIKIKYDIKNNKTINPPKTSIYDNLSPDLWWPLVIGFIDGDGCIQNQTNRSDLKISIKCHNSWLDFLNLIAEKISIETGFPQSKAKINNQGYASLIICRKESVSFLAQQALKLKTLPLERKWRRDF